MIESYVTFICGAVWPAQHGGQVEYVIVGGGFEAEDGGRGIFVVLVELFD